ncbi:dTDP-4-dehydrorhamnose 3,5-epimerase family protein [Melioribacter sp. Ez-97]|uniref:dTDP-4-dehydrorhamnose 3,5-epimerase family protein n=1 Tax=Melioribacter sp. Ez-97 TaxID=3423434 RepID=UPI003ED9282E
MNIKDVKIERSGVLPEVIIFQPSVYVDNRGDIYTSYFKIIYEDFLPANLMFNHDKFATSKKDVLRGLHGDHKTWKLVSCVYGKIFEVVVDMRENSPTYLKWDSWILDDKNKKAVLIPAGFVNGYCVISEIAVFHYKLAYEGEYVDSDQQLVVKWNDARLDINWPCKNPILQKRDE